MKSYCHILRIFRRQDMHVEDTRYSNKKIVLDESSLCIYF